MKKFSSVIVSFLCLIVMSVSLVGCSPAERASLQDISAKYDEICLDNDKIFTSSMFKPTYDSNLTLVINSDNAKYNVLKTDTSLVDYSFCGAYGVLMQAVNSTKLKTNALTIVSNNKKTSKQYKVAMFEGLDNLSKDLKKLNVAKQNLEQIFVNDSDDALVVANKFLTLNNLNEYIKSLEECLKDLLKFNQNCYYAIVKNISKPMSVDDLLYNKVTSVVLKEDNNQLINNLNLLISEFVLNYNVSVCEDVNKDVELIEILRNLLNIQFSLKDEQVKSEDKINDYKIMRTLEDSLNKSRTSFVNAVKELTSNNYEREENINKVELINTYKQNLINYGNKLVNYLNSL